LFCHCFGKWFICVSSLTRRRRALSKVGSKVVDFRRFEGRDNLFCPLFWGNMHQMTNSCCSMCCSVLQCVAVCCSVLQCIYFVICLATDPYVFLHWRDSDLCWVKLRVKLLSVDYLRVGNIVSVIFWQAISVCFLFDETATCVE